MRDTFLRLLSDDERNILYDMIEDEDDNGESSYRAKVILLKDNGYNTVPEIRQATNHHDININLRKWVHRFNEHSVDGIMSKLHKHRSINQKLTVEIERKIVEIASKNPRGDYDNLPFSTWSLRVLAGSINGTKPGRLNKPHRH